MFIYIYIHIYSHIHHNRYRLIELSVVLTLYTTVKLFIDKISFNFNFKLYTIGKQ
jgi:hypothetical protein